MRRDFLVHFCHLTEKTRARRLHTDRAVSGEHALGVSPTRPARRTSPSAPSGPTAPATGFAGHVGPADADRRRGGGGPAGSLPGDRRLPAHHCPPTTGPRHGGSAAVANERSRSAPAGWFAALGGTPERAGARLVTGRDGAAFRLWARRAGAAVRSQRELGVAACGVSGTAAGDNSAARAGGQSLGTDSDEVSGAGGTHEPGRLPANGRGLRATPLRHAGSRATLCRLAGRFAVGPRTPARLSGAVFQNTAAGAAGGDNALGRTRARPGNGRGHSAACPPPADGSIAGNGPGATAQCRVPDRARTPGARANGGTDRKGAASRAC